MTKARALIERVASGTPASQALLTEAEAPSWKPGQPVPKGWKVVFGKLVKSGGMSPSAKAWQMSKLADHPDDHRKAAIAHRMAAMSLTGRRGLPGSDDYEISSGYRRHMAQAQDHEREERRKRLGGHYDD